MKPATEERLISLAWLVVLAGVCVSAYFALTSHWTYAAAGAGLICVWLPICLMRSRRDHRRHCDALSASFASSGRLLPRLAEGTSYGFRTFTLTFPSEAELKLAEDLGCLAAFKCAIQSLYAHTGSRRNPFDADRAVWATYEGRDC